MNDVKLLIVTWFDYPLFHGTTNRINGLAAQLLRHRMPLEVISPIFYDQTTPKLCSVIKDRKYINLRSLFPLSRIDLLPVRILGVLVFSLYAFLTIIVERMKGTRLVLLYEQVFSALPVVFASKIFSIPSIGDDIRLYYRTTTSWLGYFVYLFEKFILRNTETVATSFRIDLRLLGVNKLYRKKLFFVPNGIEVRPNTTAESKDLQKVIFVGPFTYSDNVKAVSIILRLASKFRSDSQRPTFYIVGGPLSNVLYLLSSVEFERKDVIFTGRISQSSLEKLYSSAGIGLLPYFDEPVHSSQRTKALEYFKWGLVVITTPNGVDGFPDLEEGYHCYIVKDENEMYTALKEVIRHSRNSLSIAQKGQKYVEHEYAWSKVSRDFIDYVVSQMKSMGET